MPLPLGEVSPKVTERAHPLPCGELPPQRLRGLEMAEHKKALSEAASFFVWSPSSLGLKGASSPFLVGPARRNRRALAALNTRHLLRKPVCGLKAPLGLSCPPGTAVLSGSLLVPKENISGGEEFYKSNITFHTRIRSAREAIISLLPKQCSAVPHRTAKRRGCAPPGRGSSAGCGPVSRGLPASGQ